MLTKELKHEIALFDLKRQRDASHFQNLEMLQKQFVNDFPIDVIANLGIDEYIEGKGSHTSFCYRLERQLDEIGNMRGSTAAVFVVYYGKKGEGSEHKYRFTNKLGHVANKEGALEKVKAEVIALIDVGATKDSKAIHANRLSDLYKYKILGTYYPSDYLNLYSHRHIDFFISELGLNPVGKKILEKQNTLLEFKSSDELMSGWSNFEFNSFLYTSFGRPPSNDVQEKLLGTLPSMEKVKSELIDLMIIEGIEDKLSKGKGSTKPNYKEQQERNDRLGKRGENIVFNWEEAFFKRLRFPLDQLEHSSKADDRLGYDIKSLDDKGNVKFIEVKATRRQKGDANFIITDNEKEKAEKLHNYYIYIVFEAHTLHPKIWQIKEPFKDHQDKFILTPINYRVEISVKK